MRFKRKVRSARVGAATLRPKPAVFAPTLAETALDNERWYAAGQPPWKGAPTVKIALQQRLATVKRLKRFSRAFPGAFSLAAKLEACTPRRRCRSGACPLCTRALQRWLVHEIGELIEREDDTTLTVSLVAASGRVMPGQLSNFDPTKLTRHVRKAIATVEYQWAVFGLDVSLNDDTAKALGDRWVFQHYGVVAVRTSSEAARRALSRRLCLCFPTAPSVRRPVRVREFDGSAYGISYVLKTMFVRRVAYKYVKAGRSCWNTRKARLRAKSHVELLLALDQIGLSQRLTFCRLSSPPTHVAPRSN